MIVDPVQRYVVAKKIASVALDLPRDYADIYIARRCADDAALRREVEWLLVAVGPAAATQTQPPGSK